MDLDEIKSILQSIIDKVVGDDVETTNNIDEPAVTSTETPQVEAVKEETAVDESANPIDPSQQFKRDEAAEPKEEINIYKRKGTSRSHLRLLESFLILI